MKRLLVLLSGSALLSLLLFVQPAHATLATINCEGDSHTFEYTLTDSSTNFHHYVKVKGFSHDLNRETGSHTDTDYTYYVQRKVDDVWRTWATFYGPITDIPHGPHYHDWSPANTGSLYPVRFKVWQKHIKIGWPDNEGTCYGTTVNSP